MARISEKRLFEIVGSLYDHLTGSDEAFSACFQDLTDLISSGSGTLSFIFDGESDHNLLAHGFGDTTALSEYDTYYKTISPFRRTIDQLPEGTMFRRSRVCSDADFEKTEIYQDFLRKWDIYDFEFYSLLRSPGVMAGVGLSRPKSDSSFSRSERRAINWVLPHLRRVLKVHLNTIGLCRQTEVLAEALGRIPRSFLIIDANKSVTFANPNAETVLKERDGLFVDRQRRIAASVTDDTRLLWALIDSVFEPANQKAGCFGGTMTLRRPSLKRPLQVLVSPFAASGTNGSSPRRMALLFVHDPEQQVATTHGVLQSLFGLTATEAKVADLLAQGFTIDEICESLAITRNTGRTHLKRVYSKTDTNRQAELVKVILNGPATLTDGRKIH